MSSWGPLAFRDTCISVLQEGVWNDERAAVQTGTSAEKTLRSVYAGGGRALKGKQFALREPFRWLEKESRVVWMRD